MKKAKDEKSQTGMRAEYDFTKGVRGKYAPRFTTGSNVVTLGPTCKKMAKCETPLAEGLLGCYHKPVMKHYHLTAVIWKEGKHYVSKCPELGVASYGMTPEKARTALEEGVELYISNAKKLGLLKDVEPAISSEARYTAALNIAFA